MLIVENRNDLIDLITPKSKVCEIGVFKGEFSKILLEKLKPTELHLIDPFNGMMCSGDKDGNNIVWVNLDEIYKSLTENYKDNPNVILHKGLSFDVLNTFEDDYFDLIYIDGDHSYDGVKLDLNMSLKKVKKDGYICGHDYTLEKFEGVYNAVNEFCSENNLKISYLTKDGCPSFCIIK